MKKMFLAAALVVLTTASAAKAQYYVIDLSTGLNPKGKVQLTGGSLDANWKVTGAVDPLKQPDAYVVAPDNADWGSGPITWLPNGGYSSWIAANPFDETGNGLMTFTDTFNVADPLTAKIIGGAWTIDDQGTLSLNGKLLSTLSSGNWGHLRVFSATASDFVLGSNTLTMVITKTDFIQEGARLRGWLVDNTGSAALVGAGSPVPEASTWAMLVAGFAGLGLAAARSRRTFATMAQ